MSRTMSFVHGRPDLHAWSCVAVVDVAPGRIYMKAGALPFGPSFAVALTREAWRPIQYSGIDDETPRAILAK